MPISPALSTGVKGSDATDPTLSTGHAKLEATLTGVTATHAIIVVTNAFKFSTPSGDLVTGVTIEGAAATRVAHVAQSDGVTNHRTETAIWYLPNMTAGDKDVVVSVSGPLYVNWHADSWAIGATSPFDKNATATHFNPGTATISVPATGTTATLAQASELVIAAITSKYSWAFNGASAGGTAPTGYTRLVGITDDNVNQVCFQSAYRETSTTAGVSATWTVTDAGANSTGAIATFKIATVSRRVKVLANSAINGATGITAYAWSGDPEDSLATKWTGITAEASGGIVYLNNPPAGWATGADVNVILYQPSGAKKGTSFVLGRVEEY